MTHVPAPVPRRKAGGAAGPAGPAGAVAAAAAAGARLPTFRELGPPALCAPALALLAQMGFATATPVQAATIPLLAGNKDVAVEAVTGSGKTLAFVLPTVEILRRQEEPYKKHQVGAIIVSPTRELAKQIYDVAAPFFEGVAHVSSRLLVGGTDLKAQLADLRAHGAGALVGTPGRLDDVLERCADCLDLRRVEVLILDEADRLLGMGFARQLNTIIARLPKQRRTGLFSATQTEAVQELARAGLRNPVRVVVREAAAAGGWGAGGAGAGAGTADAGAGPASGGAAAARTPTQLLAEYAVVPSDRKLSALLAFLRAHAGEKVIVYFLTCACVDFYAAALAAAARPPGSGAGAGAPGGPSGRPAGTGTGSAGASSSSDLPPVLGIHGRLKQRQREAALEAFASAASGAVLLATDVAARGLDIPGVDWVVQYDMPQDPDAFVHRVGRTARAGRPGRALALLLPAEESYVEFLRLRRVPLTRVPAPGAEDEEEDEEDDGEEGEDDEGENRRARGGAGGSGRPPAAASAAAAEATALLRSLREVAETDRDLMEKGTKAFVSYVRAYQEHQCRFIFRFQQLALGPLATAFALLRLPKMPEIRKAGGMSGRLPGFARSQVDPATVRYRDKAREKQRQRTLTTTYGADARQAGGPAWEGPGAAAGEDAAAAPAAEPRRLPAARRRKLEARDEVADIEDEYRLLRKLKKGKISERQFDRMTGLEGLGGADGSDSDDGGKSGVEAGGDVSDSDDEEVGRSGGVAAAGQKARGGAKGAQGGGPSRGGGGSGSRSRGGGGSNGGGGGGGGGPSGRKPGHAGGRGSSGGGRGGGGRGRAGGPPRGGGRGRGRW